MFNCDYLLYKKVERKKVCACTNKSCRLTREQGLCKLGLTEIDFFKNDTAPLKKIKRNNF